jgi:hypothetical protein
MNSLEDEIRDTLRSEASRLREVRPLSLSTAAARHGLLAARRTPRTQRTLRTPRIPRARRQPTWLAPAAAVAVIVLVAATLVTLKSLGNPHAAPAASPSPIAGPRLSADATPRYYVGFGPVKPGSNELGHAIIAGDEQTGKTLASFPLPKGSVLAGAVAGAADDRTFVVAAATAPPVIGPDDWHLVRIFPGSADPVRLTSVHIQFPVGGGLTSMALSGDGTELAVASWTGKSTTLQVYSVATGQLQHSWSTTITTTGHAQLWPGGSGEWQTDVGPPVTDLSWVGDHTVGFAVTYTQGVREEVRTLDVSASGTDLLADSSVVWSQFVPAPPGGNYQESTQKACDTPFLTGNGQAVVCATGIYSAVSKRLSAVWLAYPVAAPTRPSVLASVPLPKDVSTVYVTVEWANPSGTELIGTWEPSVVTNGGKDISTANFNGFVGDGTVRPFTKIPDPHVAW